jgi:hypothetical protein
MTDSPQASIAETREERSVPVVPPPIGGSTDNPGTILPTILLSLLGLGVCGLVISLAFLTGQPDQDTRYAEENSYVAKKVEVEVEIDGKKHKMLVDVPIEVTRRVPVSQTETLSLPEKTRLAIVAGAGGLLGLSYLVILGSIIASSLMKKGQPPKYLRDWAEKLLVALVGLLVGFMSGSEIKSKASPPQVVESQKVVERPRGRIVTIWDDLPLPRVGAEPPENKKGVRLGDKWPIPQSLQRDPPQETKKMEVETLPTKEQPGKYISTLGELVDLMRRGTKKENNAPPSKK